MQTANSQSAQTSKAMQDRRNQIQQAVQALADLEQSGKTLTAFQMQQFESMTAEFKQLTSNLENLGQPVTPLPSLPTAAQPYSSGPGTRQQHAPGLALAAMIMAIGHGGRDNRRSAQFAQQHGFPEVAAALNKSSPSAGGYIVPPGYVAELIEVLRPQAVIRASGAVSIPMPAGQLNMGRQNTGATATYQGEGTDIAKSEPTFGNLVMSAKKLTALVPISNDLIRFANPAALGVVMNDLRKVVAQREDLAFLRDNGTGDLIKGLRYWAHADNVFAANATVNVQTITADLGKAVSLLRSANVSMDTPGWIFTPGVEQYLMDLYTPSGAKAFPEMERGLLRGIPYKLTTQIPMNLGAGANQTEVYLCDFAQALIGDATEMLLEMSSEATYRDGADLVSAFSRDETVVRVVNAHDFALRHAKAAAVITGVSWKY